MHGHAGPVDPDDDGDEVLPEVNFNATDEFNLKFFDTSTVAEEACFSGDEAGGPASVDSNGAGVSVGTDGSSVAGSPMPQTATTVTATAIAADVLHMVTSDSTDDLGDWMESFVQEQQQQEPTCVTRTASNYMMGVKDGLYGGFNINNNNVVGESGNAMEAVCDSREVRIRAAISSTGGII